MKKFRKGSEDNIYDIPTENVSSEKGTKYVSIVATHQARIRCLLSSILGKKTERFMNGAVLRFEINPTDVICNLVYQGELNEVKPEKKYYVKDSSKTSHKYTAIPFPEDVRVQSRYETNGDTYVFFLIRHGQGTHNTLKGLKKKKAAVFSNNDTRLTNIGFEQAAMTGAVMTKNKEFLSATNLFSSDLVRTIETLVTVIKQDSSNKIRTSAGKEIVVLPCTHELNYYSKGSCDGSSKQAMVGNENKPSCKSIKDCINSYQEFKINWNYYGKFYDGTRLKSGHNKTHCRTTNFLQEAIDIVNAPRRTSSARASHSRRTATSRRSRSSRTSSSKSTASVRQSWNTRKWSRKYKKSINCRKSKDFTQKQYCK